MTNRQIKYIFGIAELLAYLLFAGLSSSFAEPVFVAAGANRGQGLIFRYNDKCYLLTAKHVISDNLRAQVIAEGRIHGMASIREPFGIDLAVGEVTGNIISSCRFEFDLMCDSVHHFSSNPLGNVILVLETGQIKILRMQIVETTYRDFYSRLLDNDTGLYLGISGSFMYIERKPIGMAIRYSGDILNFIRIEEICVNLNRWLESVDPVMPQTTERDLTNQRYEFQNLLLDSRDPAANELEIPFYITRTCHVRIRQPVDVGISMFVEIRRRPTGSVLFRSNLGRQPLDVNLTLPEGKYYLKLIARKNYARVHSGSFRFDC